MTRRLSPAMVDWLLLTGAIAAAIALVAASDPLHPDVALLLAPPLALGLLGWMLTSRVGPAVRRLALAAALTAGAVGSVYLINARPVVALIPPALAVAAWSAHRWPAVSTVGLFTLTGIFGSLAAYFGIQAAQPVDLGIAGLWIATLWMLARQGRVDPIVPVAAVALAGLYVLVCVLGVLAAEDIELAGRSMRITTWYLTVFLLFAVAPWLTTERRHWVGRGFVLAGLLVGAYASFRWLTGQSAKEVGYNLARSANETVDGELKLFGSLPTRKQLGAWSATVIPLCVIMGLAFPERRWKLAAGAAAGLLALALFGSDVRVAVLAMLAGVATVFAAYQFAPAFSGLHLGSSLAAVLLVGTIGALAFALTLGGNTSTNSRYERLFTNPTQDSAYQARLYKWRQAVRDVRGHPLGRGIGTSGETQKRFGRFINVTNSDIDSGYLKIAYEQGFWVMGLYIAMLLALIVGLFVRAMSATSSIDAGLAAGGAGAIAAFAVLIYAGTYLEGLTALPAWMIAGLAAVASRSEDHPSSPGSNSGRGRGGLAPQPPHG